jgi:hypothetical protein
MRPAADQQRIRALADALAHVARAPVTVYLTGGATAVLEGWRESTVDVDVRFEPEADELLRELADLKNRLDLNIELASPPDFIPELPGWRERSRLVIQAGRVTVRHFDFYSQALAKIERGFEQDLADARRMIDEGLVEPDRLRELYDAIEPDLFRYPAVESAAFRRRLDDALRDFEAPGHPL